MFTVLFRYKSGQEYLLSNVQSVRFFPNDGRSPQQDPGPGLEITFPDGCSSHFGHEKDDDTMAFVMNAEGQTVAKYKI